MMTQKKSRIKCPSLGLTLAAHALREALEEQRVILPVTLEELQGLCARERRPRILAGYLRWQREEISRLLARSRTPTRWRLSFSTVITVRAGAFTTFRYTFLPLSGISTPCTSVSLDISPRSFFTV